MERAREKWLAWFGKLGDFTPISRAVPGRVKRPSEIRRTYLQMELPLPGIPSRGHFSVTVRITFSSMAIFRPHSRFVSGGSLFVASRPIFDPSPLSGEAKSR